MIDIKTNLKMENGVCILRSYYSNTASDHDLLYLLQYDWYFNILGYISTLYKSLV